MHLRIAVLGLFLAGCSAPEPTPHELVQALSGSEAGQAYRKLERAKDDATNAALIEGTRSKSAVARKFCARLLVARPESVCMEPLERALHDPNVAVVQEAAKGLKEYFMDDELLKKAQDPQLTADARVALLNQVEDKALGRKYFRTWLADAAQPLPVRRLAAQQCDDAAVLLKVGLDRREPEELRVAALINRAVREKAPQDVMRAWIWDGKQSDKLRAIATQLLSDDAKLRAAYADPSLPPVVRKAAGLGLGGVHRIHLGTRDRGCCDIKGYKPHEAFAVHFHAYRPRDGQQWKIEWKGPGGLTREVTRSAELSGKGVEVEENAPDGGWPAGDYTLRIYTDGRLQEPTLAFQVK